MSSALARLVLLLLVGSTFTWAQVPPEKDPLDRLLARYAEAHGGTAAFAALRNLRLRLEISDASLTLTGDYRATTEGLVRIDILEDGARVFSEGIDDRGAWQQAGVGAPVEAVSPAGAAALRNGVKLNLFGLHQLPALGHEVALAGRDTVDGVRYHVVRVALDGGVEADFYIHPDSFLVVRRRSERALHPDLNPEAVLLETVYEAFEQICGVLRATRLRQVDLATDQTVQRTQILEARCNLPAHALEVARPLSG